MQGIFCKVLKLLTFLYCVNVAHMALVHPVLDRLILRYNPLWGRINYVNVSNLGTSDFTLNSSTTTVVKIPDDTIVTLILQRKTGTQYSVFGQKLQHGMCEFIKTDKIIYDNLLKYSNYPKQCPIEPDEYYLTNYKINIGNLANIVPPGEYKIDVTVKSGKDIGLTMTCLMRGVQNIIIGTRNKGMDNHDMKIIIEQL